MPDTSTMKSAELDDVAQALAFALLYRGRKRVNDAAEMTARITAERLVEHLHRCGFVITRRDLKPPGPDVQYAPSVERVLRRE